MKKVATKDEIQVIFDDPRSTIIQPDSDANPTVGLSDPSRRQNESGKVSKFQASG